MKCPNSETLAAFIDGHLQGEEREAVVAHLADCDGCREVFAGATEFREELGSPATVAILPRRARHWVRTVAASVLLAAVAGIVYTQFVMTALEPRLPSTMALYEEARVDASALADPTAWSARWPVFRGSGDSKTTTAAEFRTGARLAELTLADYLQEATDLGVARVGVELASIPFTESLLSAYDGLPIDARERSALLLETESRVRRQLQSDYLELGRWLQALRLAALAEADVSSTFGRVPSSFLAMSLSPGLSQTLIQLDEALAEGARAEIIRTTTELVTGLGT